MSSKVLTMLDDNSLGSTGDHKTIEQIPNIVKRPLDGKENEGPSPKRVKKSKEEREVERQLKEQEKLKRLEAEAQRKREREEEREVERQLKEQEKLKRVEAEAERKREREEERKKKEQERELKKQQKEEERRVKEQKKEEEKRMKEEKKDQERKRKEEEKHKELRQQKSIASFFSIEPKKTQTESEPVELEEKSDYQRYFLPFHLKANADWVKPILDALATEKIVQEMDDNSNAKDLMDWLERNRRPRQSSMQNFKTVDVVNAMNQGLLDEATGMERLSSIPFRHLQFAEDIRPPYIGTVSKICPIELALDPWAQIVPEIKYDYDSEMEWVQADEEEDDGEDLGEEDSEDALDEEDEDMDEFLAADDDAPRRQQIIGELQPLVIWNDGTDEIFDKMQVEHFSKLEWPIDPFKDYWKPDTPRQTIKPNTLLLVQGPDQSPINKKLVPSQLMAQFLEKVHGSDMNQILLIEVLKKEFPTVSKEAIRNTIKLYAKRVGDKETDKRWAINEDTCKLFNLSV
jgi:chromatin assembly factor 1 subunit A